MNRILYNLLRLGLLVALVLTPGVAPAADAQVPQQAPPISCLQIPFLGKIIGTVLDGSSQPLGGVEVRAHATTGASQSAGVTNAAGQYGLPLPPGSYLLEFRPPNGLFQAAWYKGATSAVNATPVEVGNGKTVSGIDIKLTAGAQFSVTLRGPGGEPLPQSLIAVFDGYGRKVADGQADDQGRALTAPGLPPGSYRLLARPPYGSPLLAQYYSQKPTLDAADPLTLTQAITVEAAMALQPGAALRGTVTDATSGAPLAGITVEVRDAGSEVHFATTDQQGRYSVEALPSGAYRVEFRDGQGGPASPAPLRRTVTLSAPSAQAGFDAALARGGAISGRVTTPNGTPVPGASVSVRDIDGAIATYGSTADDGTYVIHGLPSGRYKLTYSHYSHQALAPADQVTVTAPNTIAVADTVLSPGGAISGKVTDPDGNPVEGAYVTVLDAATGKTQYGNGYTNAAGVYTTPATLPSASYIVKFQAPNIEGGCVLAIEYSGNAATAAAATSVQVSAPATVTGADAKLDYGAYIAGQLTDAASGLPLSGTVQVYDATGAVVTSGNASPLGRYRTAAALPAGSYRVQFAADGYVSLFYGGATALEAAVRVPSGSGNINMVLPRGGTITGRITAADTGAPLEHAAVTLYDFGGRVVATQLTTFDGGYRFRSGLSSGAYRLGVAPGKRDDGTPYFTGYDAVFSGGARSLEQAQTISLAAPKTVSADLAMPLTGSTSPTPSPTTPPATPTPLNRPVYLPVVQR
jgi:protocatechuate 3,4-dioxygenase beta subunit